MGATLDMVTDGSDGTGVPLKVTLSQIDQTDSGAVVQLHIRDTSSSQSGDVKTQSFVAVESSGTWMFPIQAILLNPHQPADGDNIGPGQTVTFNLTFDATDVTQVLYNGGGFVTDGQGQPAEGSAYYDGSWNVGG